MTIMQTRLARPQSCPAYRHAIGGLPCTCPAGESCGADFPVSPALPGLVTAALVASWMSDAGSCGTTQPLPRASKGRRERDRDRSGRAVACLVPLEGDRRIDTLFAEGLVEAAPSRRRRPRRPAGRRARSATWWPISGSDADFDTSTFVPLLIEGLTTERPQALGHGGPDRVVAVRLLYVEAPAALAQARRLGRLTTAQHRAIVRQLDDRDDELDRLDVDETRTPRR